jgi:hypothetical protein
MNRLLSSVTVLLGLLACPSAGSPTPQAAQKPGAKEVRPTISLTKDGLTVNGSRVQLGRTTKADLEKLLGPLERTLKLDGRRDPIGLWDTNGVRVYFSKDTGVVEHLDCVLVVGEFPALDPKQPFAGTLQVEGVMVTRKTTKAALQGKVSGKIHDHSFNQPSFTVVYPRLHASFSLNQYRTALHLVRFSARP